MSKLISKLNAKVNNICALLVTDNHNRAVWADPLYSGFDDNCNEIYLSEDQLNENAFDYRKIKIISSDIYGHESGCKKSLKRTYHASNNKYFTFRELFDIVIQFERENRPNDKSFYNYHRYFEGFYPKGKWQFYFEWGN